MKQPGLVSALINLKTKLKKKKKKKKNSWDLPSQLKVSYKRPVDFYEQDWK